MNTRNFTLIAVLFIAASVVAEDAAPLPPEAPAGMFDETPPPTPVVVRSVPKETREAAPKKKQYALKEFIGLAKRYGAMSTRAQRDDVERSARDTYVGASTGFEVVVAGVMETNDGYSIGGEIKCEDGVSISWHLVTPDRAALRLNPKDKIKLSGSITKCSVVLNGTDINGIPNKAVTLTVYTPKL